MLWKIKTLNQEFRLSNYISMLPWANCLTSLRVTSNFLKLGGMSDYLTVLFNIAVTEGSCLGFLLRFQWKFHSFDFTHIISPVIWFSISLIFSLLL